MRAIRYTTHLLLYGNIIGTAVLLLLITGPDAWALGERPVIDKSSVSGVNITREMIEHIPTARDPWTILQNTPGVVSDSVHVRGFSGSASDGGASYVVDGVDAGDTFGLRGSQPYYDIESFSEMQVNMGGMDAATRSGGIAINVVTKSGGNQFSGSANWFAQDAGGATDWTEEWGTSLKGGASQYYGWQPGADAGAPGRAVFYSDSLADSSPWRTEFPLKGSFGSYGMAPGRYTLLLDYPGWGSSRLPINVGAGYASGLTFGTQLNPKPAEAIMEVTLPAMQDGAGSLFQLDGFGKGVSDHLSGFGYDTSALDFRWATGEVLSHWQADGLDKLMLSVKVPYTYGKIPITADYKWGNDSWVGMLRTPELAPDFSLGGPIMKDKLWFFADYAAVAGSQAGIEWRTPRGYEGAGSTYGEWNNISPRLGLVYDIFNDGTTLFKPTYTRLGTAALYTGEVLRAYSQYSGTGIGNPYWDIAWAEPNFLLTDLKDGSGAPDDPLFTSSGSWQQDYDDQWALKRIGFTPESDKRSAWRLVPGDAAPVLVAVIDSGCDIAHPDLAGAVWTNEGEIPGNFKDDDGNGYVDDVHGWDFIRDYHDVTDLNGHGTVTAGIIAARRNNGIGISGVNPHALIMPVRATDYAGNGGSIELTKAIIYAVDNGARVINVSIGGEKRSKALQAALGHARRQGVVVVTAAGNSAVDTHEFSPAGLDHVITVSGTDTDDRRTDFSNWGQSIDMAAPAVDVLSLRARSTDILVLSGPEDYRPGSAVVGKDRRYYRVSGTSFSAPLVTGVASLILARNPELTPDQVTRMLLNSCRDIENPGWDQYTGYGLLDAAAAMQADPAYETLVRISRVGPVGRRGGIVIELSGVADSTDFKKAWLELGYGANPKKWRRVGKVKRTAEDGLLGAVEAKHFKQAGTHSIRVRLATRKHGIKEAWCNIDIE